MTYKPTHEYVCYEQNANKRLEICIIKIRFNWKVWWYHHYSMHSQSNYWIQMRVDSCTQVIMNTQLQFTRSKCIIKFNWLTFKSAISHWILFRINLLLLPSSLFQWFLAAGFTHETLHHHVIHSLPVRLLSSMGSTSCQLIVNWYLICR